MFSFIVIHTLNSILLLSDSDGFEFMVVSLDNSTWHFEAQSQEVRLICD